MDELQDAIQDAQYIGAMVDPTPRPTAQFKFPTNEQVEIFQRKMAEKNSSWLSFAEILAQPLGFYLFKQYCEGKKSKVQMEFLEEVIIYRKASSPARPEIARQIWWLFCSPESSGPAQKRSTNRSHCRLNRGGTNMERYLVSFSNSTLLGVTGSIVDDIGNALTQYQHSDQIKTSTLPSSLFDEVEAAVFYKLMQTEFQGFMESAGYKKFIAFRYVESQPIEDSDFGLFRVLGRGGFGMVNACIKRTTGKLYAMKMMNKKIIKSKNAEGLCLNERNISAIVDSPFVVCLKYAYQTKDDLILILDLMTGGDLAYHLSKERLSEDRVVFYAAQIFLGLVHIHRHNVVYRDLKPDNILLDETGNCKISDLGLAVEITPKLSGRCGTRGYWAPEMLQRNPDGSRIVYNHSVDYWSYGCVVYELLYGKSPFRTTKAKSYHADKQMSMDIATLEMEVEYDPKIFTSNAKSLIQGLLQRNPLERLGVNNPDDIKNHPFFAKIDWAMLENGSIKPPFVPMKNINAASQSDIGSFDMSAVKKIKLSEEDEKLYADWNFLSPVNFQTEVIEFLECEATQGPIIPSVDSRFCCTIV